MGGSVVIGPTLCLMWIDGFPPLSLTVYGNDLMSFFTIDSEIDLPISLLTS